MASVLSSQEDTQGFLVGTHSNNNFVSFIYANDTFVCSIVNKRTPNNQ